MKLCNKPSARAGLVGGSLLLLAALAQAAAFKAVLIAPEDDPRLDRNRIERAYLGHTGGPAADGIRVALKEAALELESAGASVSFEVLNVAATPEAARNAALQAEKAVRPSC